MIKISAFCCFLLLFVTTMSSASYAINPSVAIASNTHGSKKIEYICNVFFEVSYYGQCPGAIDRTSKFDLKFALNRKGSLSGFLNPADSILGLPLVGAWESSDNGDISFTSSVMGQVVSGKIGADNNISLSGFGSEVKGDQWDSDGDGKVDTMLLSYYKMLSLPVGHELTCESHVEVGVLCDVTYY